MPIVIVYLHVLVQVKCVQRYCDLCCTGDGDERTMKK